MLKKKMYKAVAAILSLVLCCSCSSPPASESIRSSGVYFDTVISVELWGADQAVLDHCMEMCEYYENLFSPSVETSDISVINHAGGTPVEVSEETAELIQTALYYSEISDGRFDPTVASAVNLWDFSGDADGKIPEETKLAEAVSHIDYTVVKVSGSTVTLTDPEAAIDLGGIAKGYIADRLKEYITSKGVKHALINLGGNMLTIGGRYDGTDFRIGIQKPFADDGTALAVLSVSDKSVVSSGNYERYFKKDGVIYHHILDPETGMPVQNNLSQVTIISDRSVDGDALSTTCYILGLEKGMELIRKTDGVEAVFVTDNNEVYTSSESIPIEIIE